MTLQLNDIVTTENETFIVTGWLHGKEIPSDTIKIVRNGKEVKE